MPFSGPVAPAAPAAPPAAFRHAQDAPVPPPPPSRPAPPAARPGRPWPLGPPAGTTKTGSPRPVNTFEPVSAQADALDHAKVIARASVPTAGARAVRRE